MITQQLLNMTQIWSIFTNRELSFSEDQIAKSNFKKTLKSV